jgi:3-deoxy-D-manno-octulosonate 8-phosphate phosphatase (KDO 8-P phosphatase)
VRKVQGPRSKVQGRKPIPLDRSRNQPSTLDQKLRRIRLLLTDVDGVMTDGSVFITSDGEFKQFDIQDGLGLTVLRRHGIKVGWISARPSVITKRRAEELRIDFLSQENTSKVAAAENILAEAGLNWEQVCFVGDDLVDLCLLKRSGVAVAVANGISEVKALAHYVTTARGGHGAVREVVTMILKAQGHWKKLVQDYTA